ncbi:hypothetical protein J1605_016560 [Eschrichtius robustus]|uniref:Uncharacterized protein n=1 Tax=Eschrichtius robustus TaxID=9764 RepID=A0AB34I5U9_ESCRO|nr:hypothetical protein J1605_016560 [Eschrichtius robustus]
MGWESNPARTHCLLTEITHLVSGLNEAQVLDVSSQKEFSERQSDSRKPIIEGGGVAARLAYRTFPEFQRPPTPPEGQICGEF